MMNTDEQKRHFMVSATAVMLYEIIFDFYCLSSHMYCQSLTFFICLFTLTSEGKAKVHLKDSMKIKIYSLFPHSLFWNLRILPMDLV